MRTETAKMAAFVFPFISFSRFTKVSQSNQPVQPFQALSIQANCIQLAPSFTIVMKTRIRYFPFLYR
ncbi:hypothetical protein C6P48_00350 [Bacillus velezensis]|nr:hypothetical protein C6P48_00350 [Bacillus velezensis]